ncbi:hypothetical protein GGX14DRAFT_418488 [Mycena pura]|uniref:Uncharacterized protein n=1 Tax=Mycena pura TaxID=153505 RepID=A0AAD6YRP3_9AGAR|nr:hypothetical protein GGX14DRAFT_418488 [Mycena pura]
MASGASRPSGVPSIEVPLNTQIKDLVQRNRTLEHTNKKLADERALDAERAKRAAHELQTQWHEERVLWREGCNRLLSSHHLAHLRLSAKLSDAEAALLREMELTRQQNVAKLHRDFQITMFRVRESELEAKVAEVEGCLLDVRREQETNLLELQEQIKAQAEEIGSLNEQKSAVEDELVSLRESYSPLQLSVESTKTKLERMSLQLEGYQTTNAELERQNDELKRANADIKRQLDRWQSLETKGGEEVETLRKQRIDLEVEVKALQGRVEKKESEGQKTKKKLAKYEEKVKEYEVYVEEQRREADNVESQLAEAKQQIERLRLELDSEAVAKPASPSKRQPSPTVSEDEVAHDIADSPPPSSPAKPPARKPRSKTSGAPPSKKGGRNKPTAEVVAGPSNTSDSDIQEVKDPKAHLRSNGATFNGSKKHKSQPQSRIARKDVSASESDDGTKAAKNKAKGKAKAVAAGSDSDAAQQEAPRQRAATRGKRKRDETAGPSRGRATSELPEVVESSKPRPHGRVVSQGRTRGGSVQPRGTAVVSDEESDEPAKKKKKRMIGLFPASSQPASFNFLPMGDSGGGIDIPTFLSPVRESDVVPNRLAPTRTGSSGSIMASFGGIFSSLRGRQ